MKNLFVLLTVMITALSISESAHCKLQVVMSEVIQDSQQSGLVRLNSLNKIVLPGIKKIKWPDNPTHDGIDFVLEDGVHSRKILDPSGQFVQSLTLPSKMNIRFERGEDGNHRPLFNTLNNLLQSSKTFTLVLVFEYGSFKDLKDILGGIIDRTIIFPENNSIMSQSLYKVYIANTSANLTPSFVFDDLFFVSYEYVEAMDCDGDGCVHAIDQTHVNTPAWLRDGGYTAEKIWSLLVNKKTPYNSPELFIETKPTPSLLEQVRNYLSN